MLFIKPDPECKNGQVHMLLLVDELALACQREKRKT
jgi:hypothetical protein